MTVRGEPPGRAGRLWLERRSRAARRAADVLDRKLRILRGEQERLDVEARRAEARWRARHAEAQTWLLRAALLGHRRGLRPAVDRPEAELRLGRAAAAGVAYPVVRHFATPPLPPGAAPAASAATDRAAAACAQALDAAVRYAVAEAAVRAVGAEVAVTRTRLRALQDRWLPRLAERTRAVLAELDEQERAEGVRLRWAARRGGPGVGG